MDDARTQWRKTGVALLSVCSNALLIVVKLAVGLLSGSVSVISEAIHSGVDMVAALIALASVRTSGKPADDEHPFGHGKYENLSGMIEAVLIFVAAAWIIKEAVGRLVQPRPLDLLGWGVGVMLLSCLVNAAVSHVLMRVGDETESIALRADAWHLRTDVYTSAGVMLGLALSWIGRRLLPTANLEWVDPVVAIVVALLIVKAAWDLTAESVRDLLDVRLAAEEETWIREHVRTRYSAVRGLHNLRTRKAGPTRFIDCHVIVDPTMSVAASHGISERIEAEVMAHLPNAHVSIHIEPCDKTCKPGCARGCFRRAAWSPRAAGQEADAGTAKRPPC